MPAAGVAAARLVNGRSQGRAIASLLEYHLTQICLYINVSSMECDRHKQATFGLALAFYLVD